MEKKKHKQMDRTSAGQAAYLDKKRDEHKKASARKPGSRGGSRR